MQMFNNTINDMDLVEIHFNGRKYTWSNMQSDSLLVKLDWVLTSSAWGLSFPATSVQPLSRPISDHIPYVINIGSRVPSSKHFRFENFWVEFPDFHQVVELHWKSNPYYANAAKTLSANLSKLELAWKLGAINIPIFTNLFITVIGCFCFLMVWKITDHFLL